MTRATGEPEVQQGNRRMVVVKRRLGRTKVQLSELGFGGAAIGNLYRSVSDKEALAALESATNKGVTYIDTAPYYGFGLSEERIGTFLAPDPAREVALSTKVGRVLRPLRPGETPSAGFIDARPRVAEFDYTRDGILRSLEESERRLGRRASIVLLHDIGGMTHGDRAGELLRTAVDEGIPALLEAKKDCRIDAIGIGVNEIEVCLEIIALADIDCILLAGRYTLLEQGALAELLPLCRRRDIAVIIGAPFNSGLLAPRAEPGATFNYEAVPANVRNRARIIYRICSDHGVDVGAAAIQFPLAHPSVVSVIPGMRSAGEVDQNLERYLSSIPSRVWTDFKSAGVISHEAPTP